MRRLAVELLFGGDPEGYQIADLASELMEGKWARGAFVPLNLPFTPYGRVLRKAERLERCLLEWIASKRGERDERDLGSIIVNSPDADGALPSDEAIAGQMPSLFAAASEASQSALAFTLLLVALHPRVAGELFDELRGPRGGAAPSLEEASTSLRSMASSRNRCASCRRCHCRSASPRLMPQLRGTRAKKHARDTQYIPGQSHARALSQWRFLLARALAHDHAKCLRVSVFSAGPHACPGYWFGSQAESRTGRDPVALSHRAQARHPND